MTAQDDAPPTDLLAALATAVARARADYANATSRPTPDPVGTRVEAEAADAAKRATDSLRAQGIIYPTHRVVFDTQPIRSQPEDQTP